MSFENGALSKNGEVEIFIPWFGFRRRGRRVGDVVMEEYEQAIELLRREEVMSEEHIQACSPGALKCHARNVNQVLGRDLNNPKPVDFLLYWAPVDRNGEVKGGTRTAVRLAEKMNIRVFQVSISGCSYIYSSGREIEAVLKGLSEGEDLGQIFGRPEFKVSDEQERRAFSWILAEAQKQTDPKTIQKGQVVVHPDLKDVHRVDSISGSSAVLAHPEGGSVVVPLGEVIDLEVADRVTEQRAVDDSTVSEN